MSDRYYSWGRHTKPDYLSVKNIYWPDEIPRFDQSAQPWLAFGMGRSYGDTCLNQGGNIFDISTMKAFTHFDTELGILRCLAGTTLDEILKLIVAKGWFLPVVPGTRFVTLGGAVANDIHGKNHHCSGTFGCHVRSFDVVRSDGTRIHCSPAENAEMFSATIGGMGLTGIITEVELQLKKIQSSQMDLEKIPFSSLQRFIELSEESEGFEYSVAWFDFISGRR